MYAIILYRVILSSSFVLIPYIPTTNSVYKQYAYIYYILAQNLYVNLY